MKKFTLILALAFAGTVNLFAQDPANPNPVTNSGAVVPTEAPMPITTVTFSETVYNFGTIEQGVPVRHKFTFTNTGTNDLKVNEVKRTCGCTSLEWSKEVIKPGEKGWVEAEFNAAAPGPFSKTIFFNANIEPNPVGLSFQGEVKPKQEMNLHPDNMLSTQPAQQGTTPPGHSAGDGHNHPH